MQLWISCLEMIIYDRHLKAAIQGRNQMTVKEFAEKYRLSYHTVYEATYRVKPESTWLHDRDYPEKELRNELLKIADQRIEKHRRLMEQLTEVRKKLAG